jgi:hypothetical protein
MALIDEYSKEELEEIVRDSTSMKQVIDKLGYSTHSGNNNRTVKERLQKYNIDCSHFSWSTPTKRNEENVFIKDSTASQSVLRKWYLKGKYTPYICSICGREPIWKGKELTLILDHINGKNHDDRIENLRWVCPNCNQQLDTTNGKNIKILKRQKSNYYKSKKNNYCIECGKEISRSATRCSECVNRAKKIPLEYMPITREELKKLIRTTSFTTIGNNYRVTDNTIRKWCDKFNLPRKKNEIKSYSDEQWDSI